MRRFFVLVLLVLSLPIATWANSLPVVFGNTGGKLTTNNSTITLKGSTLSSFSGLGFNLSGALGSVKFTTGALTSGTLGTSGTFAAGGSFLIKSNGTGGLPNGVLFTGTFSGPVNWIGTFIKDYDGTGKNRWIYTLTGQVQGTFYNGQRAGGGTVQVSFDVANGFQFGVGHPARGKFGTTTVTSVPEPGSLALLGTGLFAVGGFVRRKYLKA